MPMTYILTKNSLSKSRCSKLELLHLISYYVSGSNLGPFLETETV